MYPMYKIKLHDHRHSKRFHSSDQHSLLSTLERRIFFVSSRSSSWIEGSAGWRRVPRRRRSKEKSTREAARETILSPFDPPLLVEHRRSDRASRTSPVRFHLFLPFLKSLSFSLFHSHSFSLSLSLSLYFDSLTLIILASNPRKHAAAFLRDESFAKNETGKRVTINCTGTIVRSLYGTWSVALVHPFGLRIRIWR